MSLIEEERYEKLETTPSEEEEEAKTRNILKFLFEKPKYIIDTSDKNSPLAIKIHTSKVEINLSASIDKTYKSNIIPKLLREGAVFGNAKGLPRWKYIDTPGAPTIRKVVSNVVSYLAGTEFAASIDDLTKKTLLDKPFKVADQLLQIVSASPSIKSIYVPNKDGGIDIVSRVASMSGADKEYDVIISVRKTGEGPRIYAYCSCPIANKHGLVCKHILAVIANAPHLVLGTMDYLSGKRKRKLDSVLEMWKVKTEWLNQSISSDVEYAGFIYYLGKHLSKYMKIVSLPPEKEEEVSTLVSYLMSKGDVSKLVDTGYFEAETKKRTTTTVKLEKSTARIVWPKEMEEYRKIILEVMEDIQRRFGILDDRIHEWPLMLVFSMVMSADYRKPPITVHVVGDIGTFKTTGPAILSKYIAIPVYELKYTGPNILEKYDMFLDVITKYLEIPRSAIERKMGGIIPSVRTLGNTLRITLSIPHILSILVDKPNGLEELRNMLNELKNIGFEVTSRYEQATMGIIDKTNAMNIDDYRIRYVKDSRLGLLVKYDLFDNLILLVDEGSRYPGALESLLTKLSRPSILEGNRIVVITDNIEPFQEVITNDRYSALHDRTFKCLSRVLRDEDAVMKNLEKPPEQMLDLVHLMAVRKFVESIPVSEGALFLIRAVGNALEYKYTIASIKHGVKHIRPLRRDERADIEIDPIGITFRFIANGRFMVHTLMLSKFLAFIRRHDKVEIDDLKDALMFTVKSRLMMPATSYTDYKIKQMFMVNKVNEIIERCKIYMDRLIEFMHLLRTYDNKSITESFKKLMAEMNLDHYMAPLIISAMELAVSIYNIDISRLPDPVKYSIAEIFLVKGDTADLSVSEDIIRDIVMSRMKEIKPTR